MDMMAMAIAEIEERVCGGVVRKMMIGQSGSEADMMRSAWFKFEKILEGRLKFPKGIEHVLYLEVDHLSVGCCAYAPIFEN